MAVFFSTNSLRFFTIWPWFCHDFVVIYLNLIVISPHVRSVQISMWGYGFDPQNGMIQEWPCLREQTRCMETLFCHKTNINQIWHHMYVVCKFRCGGMGLTPKTAWFKNGRVWGSKLDAWRPYFVTRQTLIKSDSNSTHALYQLGDKESIEANNKLC